ncbi:MAG: prolyl oligopeptidase family serine peptidase [Pseudomonadota bacterium]
MKIAHIGIGAAVFWFLPALACADTNLPTVEDFERPPAITGISMSPEGDMLVGLVADPSKNGEELAAAYWDISSEIDTSAPLLPTNITPSGKRTNFYGARALKQRKSLWGTTQAYQGELRGCGEGKETGLTKKYLTKAYLGTENLTEINELPDGRAEIGASKAMLRCFEIAGRTSMPASLPLDPTDIIVLRESDKNGARYFRHNLQTGKEKFLFRGDANESIQISNRNGEPFSRTKLEFEDGDWQTFRQLRNREGKFELEPELTTKVKNRYTISILGSQSAGVYFIATDKFSDNVAVYLYDTATNAFSEQPVFAHPDFDIVRLERSQRDQDFGRVLGFTYLADVLRTFWLDDEIKSIQTALDGAFPGKNVRLQSYTKDRNRVLFTVENAARPTEHYLLVDKSEIAVIGSERPWLKDKALGETEFFYYTARDGLEIPAFVSYPPGFDKETDTARGAIIHPHGGPWARDFAVFDSAGWISYFTARGFIVLRPQYRGSARFGRKLWLAGDSEWGQKMQDDKDDGAAWLVEKGYVDADKIAIHGYSYGGFAAIAASVRPNSPYQCAIAGAGVSNLAKLENEWGNNRIQRIVQGDTVDGMDPMDNTDKINIPIQLYHGDYDVRVPLFHSTEFYNAIKRERPDSEMIVLKKMGHQSNKWLPEHKADVLENMERFLTTTCGI